jgi:hypothetical protein
VVKGNLVSEVVAAAGTMVTLMSYQSLGGEVEEVVDRR